jgi:hypothetical protein
MGDAILIASEGKHEMCPVDIRETRLAPQEAGALACLVHSLLQKPPEMEYIAQSVLTDKAAKATRKLRQYHSNSIKGRASHLWEKKALFSIWEARRFDAAGCAIVIDQDRNEDCKRLDALKAAQNSLKHDSSFPPCAVGVAVEAFDAWMICDQVAIKEAGGDPDKFTSGPEDVKKPKKKAAEIFGCPPNGTGLGQYYPAVAEKADLDNLRKCCPKGFGAFAEDVKVHLAGLAAPEDN